MVLGVSRYGDELWCIFHGIEKLILILIAYVPFDRGIAWDSGRKYMLLLNLKLTKDPCRIQQDKAR